MADIGKTIASLCNDTAKMSNKNTELNLRKVDAMDDIMSLMPDYNLGLKDLLEYLEAFKEMARQQGDLKEMREFFKIWLKIHEVKETSGLNSIVANQFNNMLESQPNLLVDAGSDENDNFLKATLKEFEASKNGKVGDERDVEVTQSE